MESGILYGVLLAIVCVFCFFELYFDITGKLERFLSLKISKAKPYWSAWPLRRKILRKQEEFKNVLG
jgi:hypothetical protein